jgi:hypothetical protein
MHDVAMEEQNEMNEFAKRNSFVDVFVMVALFTE